MQCFSKPKSLRGSRLGKIIWQYTCSEQSRYIAHAVFLKYQIVEFKVVHEIIGIICNKVEKVNR